MSQLDLLIFASDKLEPGRDYKSADTLRESIHKNFYQGCLDILQNGIQHLTAENKKIHPSTCEAINELQTTIFFMDELEHSSETGDASSLGISDDVMFFASSADKSHSSNGESRPYHYANVFRSIMTLNNWILFCTLIAIFITFLGSVAFGFYTLYSGIDSSGFKSLNFSRPPALYFNGRTELLFLIAGLDDVQRSSRTDTIILARLDFRKRDLRMISIPRDTYVQVTTERGKYWDRINAAYARGDEAGFLNTVKDLTGFYPDYLLLLNYQGFKDIVDLVGGVEVDVDKDMNYDDYAGNLHIHLKKGIQTLNGEDALGFVRFRHDAEGDFMRIRRQQQFLKTFLHELYSAKGVMKLDSIIARILSNVTLFVIDPTNPESPVTNRIMLVSQYMTLAKVMKDMPSENISMETVKIAHEGIIDRKSVLLLDYAEFDRTMSDFFSAYGTFPSPPVQDEKTQDEN
jgi:LCP family protein required for cell wall assembly